MSGTLATNPATPISSLSQANNCQQGDTILAVVSGQLVHLPISILGSNIISAANIGTATQEANLSALAATAQYQKVVTVASQVASVLNAFQAVQPISVTDAVLSHYYSQLPRTDPGAPGSVWGNAGVLTVSSAGVGVSGLNSGGLNVADLNRWLDALPLSDPVTPGHWFNNSGIPTLSSAGVGNVADFSGPVLTDALWCQWVASLPRIVPVHGMPDNPVNFWLNTAGIAVRN